MAWVCYAIIAVVLLWPLIARVVRKIRDSDKNRDREVVA